MEGGGKKKGREGRGRGKEKGREKRGVRGLWGGGLGRG